MKFILILLLLLPLFSSLEIELSCPEEVFLSEEFECEIFFKDNFLSYDVKLNLIGNKTTINQIWQGDSWQRSDWYAKNLINGKRTFVRLKINKNFLGISKGSLKIKESKTNSLVYEKDFEILVKEETIPIKNFYKSSEKEILLNSKDIKTEKINFLLNKDFLSYSGIIFLGIIGGALYLIKNKNGRRKFKEDTFGNYY